MLRFPCCTVVVVGSWLAKPDRLLMLQEVLKNRNCPTSSLLVRKIHDSPIGFLGAYFRSSNSGTPWQASVLILESSMNESGTVLSRKKTTHDQVHSQSGHTLRPTYFQEDAVAKFSQEAKTQPPLLELPQWGRSWRLDPKALGGTSRC